MDNAISLGWIIASVISALLLGALSVIDTKSAKWACFSLSFVPIYIMGLWCFPTVEGIWMRMGYSGLVGAIGGAVILVGAVEAIHATRAQTTSPTERTETMPSDNRRGNFSEGQQGGTNKQTYIEQRLPQRHIESDKIKALGSELAGKQIPVLLVTYGEIEAKTYGDDFMSAVKNSGIKWDFVSIGSASPPVYGVLVGPKGDNATFIKDALLRVGVDASITEGEPPIPGSIQATFASYVKIIVGLQDPRQ